MHVFKVGDVVRLSERMEKRHPKLGYGTIHRCTERDYGPAYIVRFHLEPDNEYTVQEDCLRLADPSQALAMGSSVILNPKSKYAGQVPEDSVGTIVGLNPKEGFTFRVLWPNGRRYFYNHADLIRYFGSNEEASALLKSHREPRMIELDLPKEL